MLVVQEGMERVLVSHRLWAVVIVIKSNFSKSGNKSSHPVQNMLFVTEPRTRDNIILRQTCNFVNFSHLHTGCSTPLVTRLTALNSLVCGCCIPRIRTGRNSVSDFGYTFFLFSDRMTIIVGWLFFFLMWKKGSKYKKYLCTAHPARGGCWSDGGKCCHLCGSHWHFLV
jgi:hypothetical protein